MRIFFIALFFCATAQAQNQGFTQQQFDDWFENAENWLQLDGRRNPDVIVSYTVDVCVEGKVVLVHFTAIGGAIGSSDIKTDADCLPSVDAQGNPLPATSFLKSLQPSVTLLPSRQNATPF